MRTDYLSIIDEKAAFLDSVSDTVWDNPELAFDEEKSAAALIEALRQEGFEVEENIDGIATAFSGRFGSGSPVIGILGEFDALSGLGQVAGITDKVSDGHDAGHGCGHNNLGVGSLGAAIAAKKYLEETGASGTVIYYGCPGEEGGSGKGFMARDGVFDELDAALCWHPGASTRVRTISSLANYLVLYKFDGVAAHAGGAPHMGRSALDAVELMNTGVQYLREHIPTSCRIHYAITDAGGISPNVVQPHAEVLYMIRAPKNGDLVDLYARVNDIAQGAALMTGTAESHEFVKASSNLVMNDAMQRRLQLIMETIAPPVPSDEDFAFARELSEKSMNLTEEEKKLLIRYKVDPYEEREGLGFGSTDVGDVSWVCPTAQINTATWCIGSPGHSWQVVAQGKQHLAHEMTRYAAKVLGAMAVELLTDPELVGAAKAEFRKRVGPEGYVPPIPAGVRPRSLNSFSK